MTSDHFIWYTIGVTIEEGQAKGWLVFLKGKTNEGNEEMNVTHECTKCGREIKVGEYALSGTLSIDRIEHGGDIQPMEAVSVFMFCLECSLVSLLQKYCLRNTPDKVISDLTDRILESTNTAI